MLCLGDSIATYQGLGGALHCSEIKAVKGLPSSSIILESLKTHYNDICVISAGSNDPLNLNLKSNLEKIRKNVKCKFIIWVVPQNKRASMVVSEVATEYNDKTVTFRAGKDHIHPKSYYDLAKDIKSKL